MDILQIMRKNASDLEEICPFYIKKVISTGSLIERDYKTHGYAQMRQYERLISFILVSLLGRQETND